MTVCVQGRRSYLDGSWRQQVMWGLPVDRPKHIKGTKLLRVGTFCLCQLPPSHTCVDLLQVWSSLISSGRLERSSASQTPGLVLLKYLWLVSGITLICSQDLRGLSWNTSNEQRWLDWNRYSILFLWLPVYYLYNKIGWFSFILCDDN